MTYAELSVEELIILSMEFIGRGLSIPDEIKAILEPDLIRDIENPETTNDRAQDA